MQTVELSPEDFIKGAAVSGIFLSKEEFLAKIRDSDVQELVEDFSIGQFELHVVVDGKGEIYYSPNVYAMPSPEDMTFVTDVERAIERKDMQIRRSANWDIGTPNLRRFRELLDDEDKT